MSVPFATQLLSAKLFLSLAEQAVIKCTPVEAQRILNIILKTCIDKLGVLYRTYLDLMKQTEGLKGSDPTELNYFVSVERLKPVETVAYILENPEIVIRGAQPGIVSDSHSLWSILTDLTPSQTRDSCTIRFSLP